MHAVKLKGITCVVVDIAVSEKDEAKGQAVFKMGCGATRTHHPIGANRITDAPVTCMACMSKGVTPWSPNGYIERITSRYIDHIISNRVPTAQISMFGGDGWRKRGGIARALKFLGYLGRRTDDSTYSIPASTIALCPEEKPDLVAIGRASGDIKDKQAGVPWQKRIAAHKKYVFTHPERYTFYVPGGYQTKARVVEGDIMALKIDAHEYGDVFRFADAEYKEAHHQEHYEQSLRKYRKEKFAETLIAKNLLDPLELQINPFKLEDDLKLSIRDQVIETLRVAQNTAALWNRRVELINDMTNTLAGQGGWETFERQYLEELDKLIRSNS